MKQISGHAKARIIKAWQFWLADLAMRNLNVSLDFTLAEKVLQGVLVLF